MLLLPLAAADPQPLEASFSSVGSVDFNGTLTAEARLAGLAYTGEEWGPQTRIPIEVERGEMIVFRQVEAHVEAGRTGVVVSHPTFVDERFPYEGPAWVEPAGPRATIRAVPSPQGGTILADVHIEDEGRLGLPGGLSRGPQRWNPVVEGHSTRIQPPYGVLSTAAHSPLETLEAPFTLFVYGALVGFVEDGKQRIVETGPSRDPVVDARDPAGILRAYRQDRIGVVLVVEEGRLLLSGLPSSELDLMVRSMNGHMDGAMGFRSNDGGARIGEEHIMEQSLLLQTQGRFDVEAAYRMPGASEWHIRGEADYVALDGAAILDVRTTALVATTFSCIVAGIWLWLTKGGPATLLMLRQRAEPLACKMRRQVLRVISERPGVTRGEIAKALDITRHTVHFHIRNLQHHGLIDTYRDGRFEHYQLNSRTYRMKVPRESGGSSGSLRAHLALLQHPLRRGIFDRLENARGPLDYKQITADWPDAPSPSLFKFHIDQMIGLGTVRRTMDGRPVMYALDVDLTGLFAAQAERFLEVQGLGDLYAVVEDGQSEKEIIQLARQEKLGHPQAVRKKLAMLVACGFLTEEEGRMTRRQQVMQ